MNILFVHEVDWLAKVVYDVHSLAEAIALSGHRVYAIDYESLWKKNNLLDFGSLKTREIKNAARAHPGATLTLRRPGLIKIPGISRLSAGFTQYFEIKKTLREKNIEAIVLYAVATNGWQTLHLARQCHVPVVFRSIDILHRLVPYRFLRPVVKQLEKMVYARADLLLPHTPKEEEYLASMGASKDRMRMLPLPLETELFHPAPGSPELRQKWGLTEDDQVIFFQGTLYDFSGLDLFLREFPALLKQLPRARLLIVGDGPQRSVLESIIAELGLNNKVVITGFQPFNTIADYTNLAEVCINPFALNDVTREIFPGKIPQYLACARPVVSTALPGLMSVIPGENEGIIYVDSVPAMAGVVISLLKSAERRQRMGQAGLSYTGRTHRSELVGRQLEAILKEVIEKKKHEQITRGN